MGGACSGSDGSSYASSDPSGRMSEMDIHTLVLEKLKTTLFSGLMSVEQLSEFAHFFQVRSYQNEAIIIKKGTPMDAFYIVGEGSIRMEVGDEGGSASATNSKRMSGGGINNPSKRMSGGSVPNSPAHGAQSKNVLCVKKTGEYFSEGMFGEQKVNDLNVIASGDVQLLMLSKASYAKYVKKYPEMPEVIRSIAMSMEKQLQQLEFFQGIDNMKMKMLVTMFNFVPLLKGTILFKENDFDRESGNSLYFLYKGRVKASVTEKGASDGVVEEKTLNTLEPGCFFGEVGLMMDIPRTATIQAVESSLLLELSQKNFRHFITIVPEILAKFNAVLLEYNIHLRYFIHNPLVLNYFIQHCKSEHSSENIEFWMACRDFRKLDNKSSQEEIDSKAAEIKKMYIGGSAEQQVNLKGSVESKVLKGLKEVPIKNTVFIDAEEEILALMSSDSFGRFKSSDLFKTCIETVNSPYTAILRKLYLL